MRNNKFNELLALNIILQWKEYPLALPQNDYLYYNIDVYFYLKKSMLKLCYNNFCSTSA